MQRADSTMPRPLSDVAGLQRVREEAAVVVDARHAAPGEELVAEHLLPEALDRLQLREEAVAAEVEAVAVELDRLGDPADVAVGLEDDRGRPAAGEHPGAGQARRAGAEHGDADRSSLRLLHRPTLNRPGANT